MSLHDVDKNSEDRGTPMPNHSDTVSPDSVKAHGTNSTNYVTDATAGPTTTPTGGNPGGGSTVVAGFKRLVLICPMTIVNDGSTLTTATLPHGLSYVPIVEASIDGANITIAGGTATGATIPMPSFTSASIGGVTSGVVTFGSYLQAFADKTNAYINMYNATGSPITITVTCYLYQRKVS